MERKGYSAHAEMHAGRNGEKVDEYGAVSYTHLRCGKELTERDRVAICLECEVALADEVIKNLEAENAALREQFEAAVEDMKRMDRYLSLIHI